MAAPVWIVGVEEVDAVGEVVEETDEDPDWTGCSAGVGCYGAEGWVAGDGAGW